MEPETRNVSKASGEPLNAVKLPPSELHNVAPLIGAASQMTVGLMPSGQLITLQLNNVPGASPATSVFASPMRNHSLPIPILAKPMHHPCTTNPHQMLAPQRPLPPQTFPITFSSPPLNHATATTARHQSCQTEDPSYNQNAISIELKKITSTLKELKGQLEAVQLRVSSLEARFNGDIPAQENGAPPIDDDDPINSESNSSDKCNNVNDAKTTAPTDINAPYNDDDDDGTDVVEEEVVLCRPMSPPPVVIDPKVLAAAVRRTLAQHGIGQRAFAERILHLRQGTVSAMLSNPRSWNQLKERGRNSYRRMSRWLSDPRAIEQLVSEVNAARKSTTTSSSFWEKRRLACKLAVKEGSGSPATPTTATSTISTFPTMIPMTMMMVTTKPDNGNNTTTNNNDTDDTPRAITTRSGRRLSTITAKPPVTPTSTPSTSTGATTTTTNPSGNNNTHSATGPSDKGPSAPIDVDVLGPAAQARIVKLLLNARMEMAQAEEKKMEKSTSNDLVGTVTEPPLPPILPLPTTPTLADLEGPSTTTSGVAVSAASSSTLAANTASPSLFASSDAAPNHQTTAATSSPWDALPATPPTGSSSGGIAGVGFPSLPPIPLEYRRTLLLDTVDIARQTKDMLQKCAISQRSFGQNVLGLSQGSVSDLLTRPKPWTMLTSKGREPFIRMKLFLENPSLLTDFGFNMSACEKQQNSDDSASDTPSQQPVPQQPSQPSTPHHEQPSSSALLPSVSPFRDDSGLRPLAPAIAPITTKPSSTSTPSSSSSNTATTTMTPTTPVSISLAPLTPEVTSSSGKGSGSSSGSPRTNISIKTPDAQRLLASGVDVLKVVADAKFLLNTTPMTQRTLGNTVLGLSQASVSDLLCKCRPWDQIAGCKPRESYVRLKLWVDSVRRATGIDTDKLLDGSTATEKPLAPKRLKTEGIFGSPLSTEMETDAACLNAQQLDVLTNFFEQCSDPEISDLIELSKQIDYPLSDVTEWFKSRRTEKSANIQPSPPPFFKIEDHEMTDGVEGGPQLQEPPASSAITTSNIPINQSPQLVVSPAAGHSNRRKMSVPTRILPNTSSASLSKAIQKTTS